MAKEALNLTKLSLNQVTALVTATRRPRKLTKKEQQDLHETATLLLDNLNDIHRHLQKGE